MARYKGTVTQSTLDWYAGKAQSAQQWFSQPTANYWAFTLNNNALDGRRIWVYDAEAVSGAAFPAGTGNTSGNPNLIAGYQGGNAPQIATVALISESTAVLANGNSFTMASLASPVAGRLAIVVLFGYQTPAATFAPPDSSWIVLGSIDGTATTPMIVVWGHILAAVEPANYVFTCTAGGNPQWIMRQMVFSGNANPGYLDSAAFQAVLVASTSIASPTVGAAQPGDLVLWCGGNLSGTNVPGLPAGFSDLLQISEFGNRSRVGYMVAPAAGILGPFSAAQNATSVYSCGVVTIKGAAPGLAPAQALSAPIQTVAPLAPGIVTLNFSSTPVTLSGITRWLPPGSDFAWHREAPIAIIDPNTNFNLAGISPENAAWASLTWLAIK